MMSSAKRLSMDYTFQPDILKFALQKKNYRDKIGTVPDV